MVLFCFLSPGVRRRGAVFAGRWRAVAAAGLGIVAAASLRADRTLARWTFESDQPAGSGPLTPEIGAGSAAGHTEGVWSKPVGNGSGGAWCSNRWAPGDYFQFMVEAGGFDRFEVNWAQVGSNTGPRDFALSYSLDGEKFVWLLDYVVRNNASSGAWSGTLPVAECKYGVELDLPEPRRGGLWFRLTAISSASAGGAGLLAKGSSRVDDFTVIGKERAKTAGAP